jgi:hypothetical protein
VKLEGAEFFDEALRLLVGGNAGPKEKEALG